MRKNKGKSMLILPSDYVVIDTETTGLDYEYCDIIEVSAVRYSAGAIVDKFSTLVKPEPYETMNDNGDWVEEYVDDFISNLTGITNEMLADAPEPAEVLPKFMQFIGDSVLIGHNVNFDINFLYDAAERHCGLMLSNNYIDTMRIARKLLPDLKHHRLSDVSAACGVAVSNAHRAEADCLTTAACFEEMKIRILSMGTEADFQRKFSKVHINNEYLKSITAETTEIDETNPIYGKCVVFTGAMSTMPRKEGLQLVANLGGIPQDSITKKTNFLVIGSEEFASCVKNGKTRKMQKAESYKAKGEEIDILSEAAFFDMISDWT